MGKRAVGLGLVVLAGAALVACGGDEKRLTAAELTKQGDAVCTTLQDDVIALTDTFPISVTFTPEQMQDRNKKLLALLDKAITSFKGLEPPKDLEQALDSAIEQAEIDRKTLEGATASPTAAQKLFETGVDPFTATGQKLAAAGITACGGTAQDGAADPPTTAAGTEEPTTAVPPTTTGSPPTTG